MSDFVLLSPKKFFVTVKSPRDPKKFFVTVKSPRDPKKFFVAVKSPRDRGSVNVSTLTAIRPGKKFGDPPG